VDELRKREPGGKWSVGIVGAGVTGLSAARALLDRGIEFDLFEPAAPGGAQSRGKTRLFMRRSKDPRIIALIRESLAVWSRWQREAGTELFARPGVVSFGKHVIGEDSRARAELDPSGIRNLSDDQLARLLPILGDPAGPATLDPESGAIWARVAIGVLLGWAGEYLIPRRVDAIEPLPDGRVRIHAGDIQRDHDAAIVAAGLGTGELARSLGVEIPIRPRAKVLTTHAIAPSLSGRPLPAIRGVRAGGETAYGMPVRTRDLYKIGFNRDLETSGDGSMNPEAVHVLAGEVEAWVREVMPGLVPDRLATFADWAIELPWGLDAIGVWRAGPVLMPAGMKMFGLAPVLGEVLADAAEGRAVREDFRPEKLLGEPQPGF